MPGGCPSSEPGAIPTPQAAEAATLDALRLLETSKDGAAQRAACIRYGDAVTAWLALSTEDQLHADAYLVKRGRVTKDASRIILAAMELLDGDYPLEQKPN